MSKAEAETYSIRDAALATGYCLKHLRDLVWENRVPDARKVDGKWRIPKKAVEALKLKRESR